MDILRNQLENETGLVISSKEKWKEFCLSYGDDEIQKLSQRKIDFLDNFWKKVFSLLNISETYFNRDSEQVHSIFEEVIAKRFSSTAYIGDKGQELHSSKPQENKMQFTAWSAGCSRGEEAYTLAIHLQALKETRFPGLDWEVWGSDIQESSIEWARRGRYEKYSFRSSFPQNWNKYWISRDEDLVIHQDIAKQVHFELENLIRPSSRKYDLVFCRNVLIYISENQKKMILENLINSLKPGGILVTGHSELTSFIPESLETKHIHKKTTYYTLPSKKETYPEQKESIAPKVLLKPREEKEFLSSETKIPKFIKHKPETNPKSFTDKIRHFKERIYSEPGDLEAYYELASLYWENRERDMAKIYQQRARILVKNDPNLVDKWKERNTWKLEWVTFLNEDL